MRHPFLGAVIAQRQDRAAVGQKLFGTLGNRGQRVATDQHGLCEVVRRGFEIPAVELILVGEGDRVHHKVDLAPCLLQRLEHRIDGRGVGDVAMPQNAAAQLAGQWLDPFLERVALPGQGDFRARGMAGFGDAPGNRSVIGDAEDHPALALHQT
jgi:hypothetical protein